LRIKRQHHRHGFDQHIHAGGLKADAVAEVPQLLGELSGYMPSLGVR
jgi:hypothetical protein